MKTKAHTEALQASSRVRTSKPLIRRRRVRGSRSPGPCELRGWQTKNGNGRNRIGLTSSSDPREPITLPAGKLGELAFQGKHIPGSLNLYTPEGLHTLDPNDDIVVYCSNPTCIASQYAYNLLESNGYEYVKRYAGGIEDWEKAGYPMEGEMVSAG